METTTKRLAVGLLLIFVTYMTERGSLAQSSTLDADPATKGSVPYRETVDAYLRREQPKIVNGKPAPAGAFPWQVSLGVSWIADPFSAHFCGGSVLSEKWIITAAHCVDNLTPGQVIVTAGTTRLVSGAVRRNVNRIVMHRSYNGPTHDNDIALIELRDPLPTGLQIRKVDLLMPGEDAFAENSVFTVMGWGYTSEAGSVVRDLRYIDDLPFVPRQVCNSTQAYHGQITNNMLCAGFRTGGKDSCKGDSGGSLTFGSTASPKLAGIVSWGEGCARTDRVGIYTRVINYIDWINPCISGAQSCNQ